MAATSSQLPATSSDGFHFTPLAIGKLGDNSQPIIYLDSDDEEQGQRPSSGPSASKRKRSLTPKLLDPLSGFLSQILDIVPDIDVAHAEQLIAVRSESAGNQGLLEAVLATIFEKDYPKQAKVKAVFAPDLLKDLDASLDEDGEFKETGNDYLSDQWRKEERSGMGYLKNTLQALEQGFDRIPSAFIRTVYFQHLFYTPAYRALEAATQQDPLPYTALLHARSKPKGKQVQRDSSKRPKLDQEVDQGAEEFEREKAWWEALRLRKATFHEEKEKREKETKRAVEAGEGLPCGCCFDDYLWDDMVQCSEGHLFCKDCSKAYIQGKIGGQITKMTCMSSEGDGCPSVIPDSEIIRILPTKALDLYHRLKQAKEIEDAKLAGLENCPNCPWACVIEDESEKLFRCGNEQCGNVTCRKCQRPDHIPKTCEEVEADRRLDNRHAVEEAMSDALMRKCPKCEKSFIKEEGCNKITCSNCHTLSCYVCREIIKGYDHFQKPGTCSLYDQPDSTEEVARAREHAQEAARTKAAASGVQLDDNDLDVELPPEDPRFKAQALARAAVAAQQARYEAARVQAARAQAARLAAANAPGAAFGVNPGGWIPPVRAVQPGRVARAAQPPQADPALLERQQQLRQELVNRDVARDRAIHQVRLRALARFLPEDQILAAEEEQRNRNNLVTRAVPEQYARFLVEPDRDMLRRIDNLERTIQEMEALADAAPANATEPPFAAQALAQIPTAPPAVEAQPQAQPLQFAMPDADELGVPAVMIEYHPPPPPRARHPPRRGRPAAALAGRRP